MPRRTAGPVEVSSPDLKRLLGDLKNADKKLATAMRRELKAVFSAVANCCPELKIPIYLIFQLALGADGGKFHLTPPRSN